MMIFNFFKLHHCKSYLLSSLLGVLVWLSLAFSVHATTKIVFLGDSLTEGYGVEYSQAFPSLVQQKLLKQGYDVQVINGGVSGSTSASAVKRFRWFLKSKPDIVFLALGANDGLRGLSAKELKLNLSQTIELAKKHNMQIVLAGMLVPPNYGAEYAADFRQVFLELASEHEVIFMPFLLDQVAAKPKLNLSDGIHPNVEGHKIIAENIFPYLKPLL